MTLADALDDLDDMAARIARMLAEIPPRRYRESDAFGYTDDAAKAAMGD